ncbi:CGNR zinc finger domain-containing protein [Streptomyces sp. NBC_01497]|uniref:CGNR zinc finger domain-containing protein n=1 Tax=Streptomyces sp. NBC_01497 TaxID=2903885 RepID=UPI002E32B1B8|nr:CGNR zinc finger domain-containing protein [Streptomyces sp. NBC_01497]
MRIDEVHEDELLELLNTTPVVNGAQQDLLADDDGARAWLDEHGLEAAGADLRTLRRARDVLQKVVRKQEEPAVLQKFLTATSCVPDIGAEGLEWRLEAPEARMPVVMTVLAWGHLQRAKPGRLRPCANPDCRLFLLDRSKPNKARWCSMTVCGNRMKARRHYARAKENAAD